MLHPSTRAPRDLSPVRAGAGIREGGPSLGRADGKKDRTVIGVFSTGALSYAIAAALILGSLWLWAAIWRCVSWVRRVDRATRYFRSEIWAKADSLQDAAQRIEADGPQAPMEAGFLAGIRAFEETGATEEPAAAIWRIERRMRAAAQAEVEGVRRDLSMMGIVAAAAPLAGLLGTVLGIVSAFIGLAESGGGTLAAVAPGLAEALVTTGLGLLAAIPAVMVGTYIRSTMGRLDREFRAFADDLLILVRGAIDAGRA